VVSAAVDGGKLMGYFNLPCYAWGSAEMHLGEGEVYNTLVRVTSPYDRLATAVIKLFVYYNVRSTIRPDNLSKICFTVRCCNRMQNIITPD